MLKKFKRAVTSVVDGLQENIDEETMNAREAYSRPDFLLLTDEETPVSADHNARPILVPRDIARIPWRAGYAEVINGGKTPVNEDQAYAETILLPPNGHNPDGDSNRNNKRHSTSSNSLSAAGDFDIVKDDPLPFTYFGVFDGHAGPDAAIMARRHLHLHITRNLRNVRDLLIAKRYAINGPSREQGRQKPLIGLNDRTPFIPADDLVKGALESAFLEMDEQIYQEKQMRIIKGGCAVVIAIFFMGKLYVANAGDCRAILTQGEKVIPMSKDFTPESDRQRIQYVASSNPDLLKNEFSCLEFAKRVTRKDLGKKVLYRDYRMTGWAYKTVCEEDLRFPLLLGEGKKARILATIGVARGFGDFDLGVYDSDIKIKPFLTAEPGIEVYDMSCYEHGQNDVLIMASDGLWDVLSNQRASEIVKKHLGSSNLEDKKRYTSAAQDLILHARGLLDKSWKTFDGNPGSYDDITVFVIPLHKYYEKDIQEVEFAKEATCL